MYISHTPYINQSLNKKPVFSGTKTQVPQPVAKSSHNGLKKIFPWILGFMGVCCGSSYTGGNNATFSGSEDSLGIHVQYTDVSKEIRDSVMKPVYQLKAKLNKENDFLNGMEIDVAHSLKKIKPDNDWREYVINNEADNELYGTSFYSDSKIPKKISIQEISHGKFKSINKDGKETILPAMRHTLMHEAGHHFDSFFGHNHNSRLALQWDSVLAVKDKNPFETPYDFEMNDKDEKIDDLFTKRDGLSDKPEYKKAFYADINNIRNIPQNKLPIDIEYYTCDFDLKKAVPWMEIELADEARGEAYANLFAYVMGENDGEKEKFLKCFPNCNKVVKRDVAKFLKLVK